MNYKIHYTHTISNRQGYASAQQAFELFADYGDEPPDPDIEFCVNDINMAYKYCEFLQNLPRNHLMALNVVEAP